MFFLSFFIPFNMYFITFKCANQSMRTKELTLALLLWFLRYVFAWQNVWNAWNGQKGAACLCPVQKSLVDALQEWPSELKECLFTFAFTSCSSLYLNCEGFLEALLCGLGSGCIKEMGLVVVLYRSFWKLWALFCGLIIAP